MTPQVTDKVQMQDQQMFQLYRPLRNHLRQVCLDDSFFVIWAYVQHLQFNRRIPAEEIEVPELFESKNRIEKNVYEWDLELLTRETIINGQQGVQSPHTFSKWSYLSGAINKIRELEDEIVRRYVNSSNILTELYRTAHRQWPWQDRPRSSWLTRYFKIFNDPHINGIVQEAIGLTIRELYIIGTAFIGAYLDSPAVDHPVTVSLGDIDPEKVGKFLNCFSQEISKLKERLIDEQEMNDKFVYSYSSLRGFPIIRMLYRGKDCLCCPLPTLLFWRMTAGLYYEICDKNTFGHHFGHSFQNYVGEVIEKAKSDGRINFLPEEEYYDGRDRKDTIDWIVFDDESALFVECKTKRIKVPAKISLDDAGPMKEELEAMARSIIQTYRTIEDYRNNKYPKLKFKGDRKIFPMILSLEDWYLFGDKLLRDLKELVRKQLAESYLPLSYLDEMPYAICSLQDFEEVIQVIQHTGIQQVMNGKVLDTEKSKWTFKSYLQTQFPQERKAVKFLFSKDYEDIFSSLSESQPFL